MIKNYVSAFDRRMTEDCYAPLRELSPLTSKCLRIITQGNLNDIHDEMILGNYFDFVNVMLVL